MRFQVRGSPFFGFCVVRFGAGCRTEKKISGLYETPADAMHVRNWFNERELGYPNLKKFEGGANWPASDIGGGPLYPATCCKCGKTDMHERPVTGVYFCGYGCT